MSGIEKPKRMRDQISSGRAVRSTVAGAAGSLIWTAVSGAGLLKVDPGCDASLGAPAAALGALGAAVLGLPLDAWEFAALGERGGGAHPAQSARASIEIAHRPRIMRVSVEPSIEPVEHTRVALARVAGRKAI
jgi:hypothetical protein